MIIDITEEFILDLVAGLLMGVWVGVFTYSVTYGTLVALYEGEPVVWWVWTQEFLIPFLDTRVCDSLQALEECGISLPFYAPVIEDVESFLEYLFC